MIDLVCTSANTGSKDRQWREQNYLFIVLLRNDLMWKKEIEYLGKSMHKQKCNICIKVLLKDYSMKVGFILFTEFETYLIINMILPNNYNSLMICHDQQMTFYLQPPRCNRGCNSSIFRIETPKNWDWVWRIKIYCKSLTYLWKWRIKIYRKSLTNFWYIWKLFVLIT